MNGARRKSCRLILRGGSGEATLILTTFFSLLVLYTHTHTHTLTHTAVLLLRKKKSAASVGNILKVQNAASKICVWADIFSRKSFNRKALFWGGAHTRTDVRRKKSQSHSLCFLPSFFINDKSSERKALCFFLPDTTVCLFEGALASVKLCCFQPLDKVVSKKKCTQLWL